MGTALAAKPERQIALDTSTSKAGRPKERPVIVSATRDPWDRLPDGESAEAFRVFCHFRDSPADRTLQKTADATGKTLSSVRHMSSRYDWPARVKALVASKKSDYAQRVEEQQLVVLTEQAAAARLVRMLADQRLTERLAADDISTRDLVVAQGGAAKAERAILGAGHLDAQYRGGPGNGAPSVNVSVSLAATDPRLTQFATCIAGWAETAGLTDGQLAGLVEALGTVV